MTTNDDPLFSVRSLGTGSEYVVDATWSDGTTEKIAGIFPSPEAAALWVNEQGAAWVLKRLGKTLH
jgi:hypothetical protein